MTPPIPENAGEREEILARAEQCPLYNFDSVEMVECKHELFKAMIDALRDHAARALPVDEEELARCLYEAEYDGEAYPWHRQRSDEQLTYREQAKKVLRDYAVTRPDGCQEGK